MFCRGCGYCLDSLVSRRCPECGSKFDLSTPATMSKRAGSLRLKRWARRVAAATVCLALIFSSLVAVLVSNWRWDHDAALGLHAFGGQIRLERRGPAWLKALLGSRFGYLLDRADMIDLDELPVTDDDFRRVARLHELTSLSVGSTKVTDAGLVHLEALGRLEYLNLGQLDVSDRGMMSLRELRHLRDLNLSGTKITGAGLEPLSGMRNLVSLDVAQTKVDDGGLAHLEGLPQLEDINLSETRVTDAGLTHLARLPALSGLNLEGTKLSDNSMAILANCRKLTHIGVGDTGVTEAGAASLKRHLPKIVIWHAVGESW